MAAAAHRAPDPHSDPTNGFSRDIVVVEYKPILHSTCNYCGFLISGTTSDKVWAEEAEHRDICGTAKKPPPLPG